jgi:hypothetical protein
MASGTKESVWGALSPDHRRWFFWQTIVIAAIVNAILNALIAWIVTLGEEEVPLWAIPLVEGPSVIVDTVGTFFVLTFLTTLAVTTAVWHELEGERLGRLEVHRRLPFADRVPPTRRRRATMLGLLCMALLGPPAVVALIALDFGDLSIGDFVLYKAIFGVVLGLMVTPIVALLAFGDERGAARVEPGTAPA